MTTQEISLLGGDSYFYLRPNGEGHTPTRDEVVSLLRQGVQPIFHLDANACIHIANYGKGEKLPPKERWQVELFLATLANLDGLGIVVYPGFAVAELATHPATLTLDTEKATRIDDLVQRGMRLPIDLAMKRGMSLPILGSGNFGATLETIEPCVPLLRLHHACYLKIVELALGRQGPRHAVTNLRAFISWLREDLGSSPMLPLQAALAVFGGKSEWGTFCGAQIKDDAKRYRKVWSATMDTFHLQMIYFTSLVPMDGTHEYPMLVTSDAPFYQIFCKAGLLGGVVEGRLAPVSWGTIDYGFPYFEGREEEIAGLLRELSSRHDQMTVSEYLGRDRAAIRQKAKEAWEKLAPSPEIYRKKGGEGPFDR